MPHIKFFSQEEFGRLIQRLGRSAIEEALTHFERLNREANLDQLRKWSLSTKAANAALSELFLIQPEEELYERYLKALGISEPARVPRQSPKARDIPRKEENVSK